MARRTTVNTRALPVEGASPYREVAEKLIAMSGCTIIRWRDKATGAAFTTSDEWEIEVPRPTGPYRFGVFAHEVGHQLLHRRGSKPRWVEEVEAWEYAFDQFAAYGLPALTEDEIARAQRSLDYAFGKAIRRSKGPVEMVARMEKRAEGRWWTVTDDMRDEADFRAARLGRAKARPPRHTDYMAPYSGSLP